MILKGAQRGGAGQLADHLLNLRDNDHVSLHELRGFMADDLHGALNEAHAISKATRCQQFMFSLSLNPPKEAELGPDGLLAAADRAEAALGLDGQPRAIVIHEKEGRRHAHVVWSRIDADQMKAINLPHFKNRLNALSKDLYLEYGWELPRGHRENGWKNPLNFTLAEWQQAKRLDLDPREIKQVFREAWAQSDNQASFRNALEERGYFLARGDRRGFVALDIHGEVFALARWAGLKTKEVAARLGSPEGLPGVEEVRQETLRRISQQRRRHLRDDRQRRDDELKPLAEKRAKMVAAHRDERVLLGQRQNLRWLEETRERSARFRRGLSGLYDFLTGRTAAIRRQNEREAYESHLRDKGQREALFAEQMRERQALQIHIETLRTRHREQRMALARHVAAMLRAPPHEPEPARRTRERGLEFDLS
jgi:hypothetical protein